MKRSLEQKLKLRFVKTVVEIRMRVMDVVNGTECDKRSKINKLLQLSFRIIDCRYRIDEARDLLEGEDTEEDGEGERICENCGEDQNSEDAEDGCCKWARMHQAK